jgi:hypothetical protein
MRSEHPSPVSSAPDLSGRTVLYVGGQIRQIPHLRTLVGRNGGRFLYHDGGVESGRSRLPELVAQADISCFPIDCVSHHAVGTIKRLCGRHRKPYRPLRTASVSALRSVLLATDGPDRL